MNIQAPEQDFKIPEITSVDSYWGLKRAVYDAQEALRRATLCINGIDGPIAHEIQEAQNHLNELTFED